MQIFVGFYCRSWSQLFLTLTLNIVFGYCVNLLRSRICWFPSFDNQIDHQCEEVTMYYMSGWNEVFAKWIVVYITIARKRIIKFKLLEKERIVK